MKETSTLVIAPSLEELQVKFAEASEDGFTIWDRVSPGAEQDGGYFVVMHKTVDSDQDAAKRIVETDAVARTVDRRQAALSRAVKKGRMSHAFHPYRHHGQLGPGRVFRTGIQPEP